MMMFAAKPHKLTDTYLKNIKAAAPGQRYWVMDTQLDAFGVLVNDAGKASFLLNVRYPGSEHPSRRILGRYGEMTLAEARAKATDWKAKVARGIDPREEAQKAARANLERRANTVRAVVEDFIADKLPSERKGKEVARDMRREFIGAWGDRPITEIDRAAVVAVIKAAKDRGSPHQARNLLGYASRFFNWAIVQGRYGIETSPCDRLKPKDLVGKKTGRSRILDDAELRAVWEGAGELGIPFGMLFRVLILTGQRRNEIARARRRELTDGVLLIPAERMKAGKAHAVPLSAPVLAIVNALPTFESKDADYLFSTTTGQKPVNGFSKAKTALDTAAAKALGRPLEPFTIQDIRRTVRSGLSRLKVTEEAREAVIAHARPGIKGAYDWHDYLDEKREALDLWAARVAEIVAPKPDPERKVIQLRTG